MNKRKLRFDCNRMYSCERTPTVKVILENDSTLGVGQLTITVNFSLSTKDCPLKTAHS